MNSAEEMEEIIMKRNILQQKLIETEMKICRLEGQLIENDKSIANLNEMFTSIVILGQAKWTSEFGSGEVKNSRGTY